MKLVDIQLAIKDAKRENHDKMTNIVIQLAQFNILILFFCEFTI